MPRLSVTIITLNEAAHVAAAIESVAWADEVIVVDSGSADETVEIARRYTDRVLVREWPGYVAQKNFAASLASHDWILSVDADERVSPPLRAEIGRVLAQDPEVSGFRIPRATHYLGRWVRSTDWYPDYQLRLYDRRVARWEGRLVHESVRADGPVGRLRHELFHHAYRDITHHIDTINRYTTLAARQMYEGGSRASVLQIATHPVAAFARNYVLRRGFMDGGVGLLVSSLNAYYVLLKFAKLWEMDRQP